MGLVAQKHGRSFIGIDIDQEYCELARSRIEEVMVKVTVENGEDTATISTEDHDFVVRGFSSVFVFESTHGARLSVCLADCGFEVGVQNPGNLAAPWMFFRVQGGQLEDLNEVVCQLEPKEKIS